MERPYPLDLAFATSRQFRSPFDGLTSATQRDNTLVDRGIRYAAGVLSDGPGKLDTLSLPLAAGLIIIASHLQSKLEQ